MALVHCEYLLFDVFGTVVDWLGTVSDELKDWAKSVPDTRQDIDWIEFTKNWRRGYYESVIRYSKEGNPRNLNLDQTHREILDKLIDEEKGLESWNEDVRQAVNEIWHRLNPWKDSVKGLETLKKEFKIGTLTNGNLSLMVDMAKHAGLPWDFLFTSDLLNSFKPNLETYKKAISILGLDPQTSSSSRKVGLVAAHLFDLEAAKKVGMTTIFIKRKTEDQLQGEKPDYVDFVCEDLEELGKIAGGLPMA